MLTYPSEKWFKKVNFKIKKSYAVDAAMSEGLWPFESVGRGGAKEGWIRGVIGAGGGKKI